MVRILTKFKILNKEEGNIVIILRGGTGVGKTTIAKLLAQKLMRSVHIEQDILRYMIVNGLVASRTSLLPGIHPKEYQRQCRLADENTYDLIKNFTNAGFNTIVDGFNGGESGHTFYFLEQHEDISWYPDEALVKKKLPDITLYQIVLDTKEEILIKRLKEVKKCGEDVISFILKQRTIFLEALSATTVDLIVNTSEMKPEQCVEFIIEKLKLNDFIDLR